MLPDPSTFRVLPWARKTGWLLADVYLADGRPVPFATRAHLPQRRSRASPPPATTTWRASRSSSTSSSSKPTAWRPRSPASPARRRRSRILTHGYQYLSELRFDQIEPVLEIIRRDIVALGLPLRSVECEYGPEPVRVHLSGAARPGAGRHHGAVPQRREADLPAARPARHLHVPAAHPQRHVVGLAPAPVAGGPQERRQRLHGRPPGRAAVRRGAALPRRPPGARARRLPCSPRRRSTATSASARTRWRPTAQSGATTTAAS